MSAKSLNKKVFMTRNLFAILLTLFLVVISCLLLSACGQTTFKVLLFDEDKKTVLFAYDVEKGDSITDVTIPTKQQDEQYTYTFSGWVDENGDDVILAFIDHDITAYATYEAHEREYSLQITVNGSPVSSYDQVEIIREGSYLTTGSVVHYGDVLDITVNGTEGYYITGSINYSGLERVDEGNETYFRVVGDVEISFNEEPNQYTVRFLNYDGSQLYSTLVNHGQGATTNVVPTRETDLRASYIFDYWADIDGEMLNLNSITSNVTAYAHFKEILIDYTLSINNTSKVSIFNGDIELFDGSTIHYNDILTVVLDVTDGYHVSSLLANDQDISTNLSFSVVGDMEITYAEEINSYTVALYDENRTTSLLSTTATHGSSVTVEDPSKEADNTYTYKFIGWFDENGDEVDLSFVDGNITAYAKYQEAYIEYALTMTDRVTVKLTDGTEYTSEFDNPTLHFGDTFTVEYELAPTFQVNEFLVTGATLSDSTYTVTGAVNIKFSMKKTFEADTYKDLQKFVSFEDSDGSVISIEECTDNGATISYTYVGLEAVDFTANYADFLEMEGTIIYEGQAAHTPSFDNNVFTASDMTGVATITTPLYKGMSIEFAISEIKLSHFMFGISTKEWLDDAINHTSLQNSVYYFAPEYNFWSYSTNTKLSYLYSVLGSNPSMYVLNSNYNFYGDVNCTIRLVLNDTLELYVDDVRVEIDTSVNARVPDYTIADDTAYYFSTYIRDDVSKITFTDFGYYENTGEDYLEYLKGKTITTFGDSITQGSGASSNEKRYASLLSTELGMKLNNMGIGNTGYCTGRENVLEDGADASRIEDVSSIPLESEIVIVFFGINDIRNSSSSWGLLGDVDSDDTSTIYGAINAMYSALAERFADSTTTIFVCSPTPPKNDLDGTYVWGGGYTLQNLNNVIKERATHYGFQFIDLLNNCGFTEDTITDSVHPGDEGHAIIANLIYNAIVEYGKNNYVA